VLRAKRLGFSLTDIHDYIELYEADPDHKEQLQLLLSKVRHRMQDLQQQQEDLVTTLGELEDIQTLCVDHLIRIDESAQVD
jgi:DNA-binding transcriptional MerR regulator